MYWVKCLYILTGCTFFSNICGLEIIDEIGIIFSITGVGVLNGSDLARSCSGLFGFFNEDAELTFERRGGGDGCLSTDFCRRGGDGCLSTDFCRGGGDGCFLVDLGRAGGGGEGDGFLSIYSWLGEGDGDGCFWIVFCGEGFSLWGFSSFNGDLALGWASTGESTRLDDNVLGVGDGGFFADCCLAGDSCFGDGDLMADCCWIGDACLGGSVTVFSEVLTGDDCFCGKGEVVGVLC